MRTQPLLAAALLAITHLTIAAVNIELYSDIENYTRERIFLASTGCHDVTIYCSAKGISGGTFTYSGAGYTSLYI
ncbi:hypothetical protein GGR58DRAFT_478668 [Xylaria digitata]|nr:hypothetical protein GGR58DRAFT_478668 [Xylaria digitata]